MRDPELLVQDILDNKIAIKELTSDELDVVVDQLVEIGEGLLGTDHHDVGEAILQALDTAIDIRTINNDFEQAIVDAESRGSVYYEFEEYIVH